MATGGNVNIRNLSSSQRFGALSLSQSPSLSQGAPFQSVSQSQHLGESQGQSDTDSQRFLQIVNNSSASSISSSLSTHLSSALTVTGDFQPACGTSTSSPILHAVHGSCSKNCKKRFYHAVLHYHHPDDHKLACDVKAHLESITLNYLGVEFPVRVTFLSSLTNKVDVECIGEVLKNEMTKVFVLLCTDSYLRNKSIGMKIIHSSSKSPSPPDVIELFFDQSTMKGETTELVRRVLYEPNTGRFMDEMSTILMGTSFEEQIHHDNVRKACEERRRKALMKGEKTKKKTHSKKTFSLRSRRGKVRAKETDLSSAVPSSSALSSDTDYQSRSTHSMKSGSQKIRHVLEKFVTARPHLKPKANDSSDETSLPPSQTAGSETMTRSSDYRGDVSSSGLSASGVGDSTDCISEPVAIQTGTSQVQLTAGSYHSSETRAKGMPTQQPTSSVYHSHQMEGAVRSDHEKDLHQTVPKTFATELTLLRDRIDESVYSENASSGSELNSSEQPIESDDTHKVIFTRFQGAAGNNLAPYTDEGFIENTHKRFNCHPREKSSVWSAQSHQHRELSESCSDSASEQRGNRRHKGIKSSDEELDQSTPCFNDLMTSSPSDEEQDADDSAVACQMSNSRGAAAQTNAAKKNPTLTRETDFRNKPRAVVTPMTQNHEDSDDDELTMRKTVCTVDNPAHASNVNKTPHTSNVSTALHTSNVNRTSHISNVSTTLHTSNVDMMSHISDVSTTPHTSNINPPQASNVEPTPHASNISTMLHTSNVSTLPHTSVVNLPHSSNTNTMSYASNVNTTSNTSNINTMPHTTNISPGNHLSESSEALLQNRDVPQPSSSAGGLQHTSAHHLSAVPDTEEMSATTSVAAVACRMNVGAREEHGTDAGGRESAWGKEDGAKGPAPARCLPLTECGAQRRPVQSTAAKDGPEVLTEEESQDESESQRPISRLLSNFNCSTSRSRRVPRREECSVARDDPEMMSDGDSQDENESGGLKSRLWSYFSCSLGRSRRRPRRKRKN